MHAHRISPPQGLVLNRAFVRSVRRLQKPVRGALFLCPDMEEGLRVPKKTDW